MTTRAKIATLLKMAAFCLSAPAAVTPGVWNGDFAASLEYATKNNLPIVVVWGNTACHYCNNLVEAIETDTVKNWVANHEIVLVLKHVPTSQMKEADYVAAKEWIEDIKDLSGYPFVGFWRKNADGTEKSVAFTGRAGMMPATEPKKDLAGQFAATLERYFGENADGGTMPPAPTALSATDDGPMAVRLDWKGDASYEISCYKIYRSENENFEDAELIAEVAFDDETVFFDSDVSPDSIYSYWVVAANDIFESEPAGPVFGCCEENFYIDEDAQLPVGYVGEDYVYQLKAVFDNGWLSWEIDEFDYGDGRIESLPEGMTLSSDGLLSGVPAAAGTYRLWIYFYDVRFPDGEASCACLTLEVRERGKPNITGSSPEGFAPVVLWGGESRLFLVEADDFAGGNLTYSWFVDGVEVQSGAKSAYRLRTNGYKPGTVHEVACFANNDNSMLEVSRRWTVKIPAGTLYVDAATGDDARDGLTKETAFASIQAAIDKAVDGDTIIVADGVYGPIGTRNLYLTIESENGYKGAIIDGGGDNCCAQLCGPEAEDREYDEDGNIILPYGAWDGTNTRLCGFTLRNGRAMFGAGATGGTLEQCLIIDNVAEAVPYSASRSGAGGGAIRSVLRYCTIAGNNAIGWHDDDDNFGNGIVGEGGGACDCTLENCIVWNNIAEVDADCSNCETTGCVAGADPLFADAANGDWRVLPQSPCVSGGVVAAGCESEIAPGVVPGELPGDALAWVAQYKDAFGSDPAVAMAKPTGKKSASGAPLRVWHDYVAGTDPLDTNSVFTATIKMVDGKPVVEWSPHLDNRVYTIYGKTNLTDKVWLSPTNSSSRFFKVEVTLPKGE